MAIILTKEQYEEQIHRLQKKIASIESEEETWLKFLNHWSKIRKLWFRDKVYAVKHLNWIEQNSKTLNSTEKACLIQVLELLQKLILHKKENPPQKRTWRAILKNKPKRK